MLARQRQTQQVCSGCVGTAWSKRRVTPKHHGSGERSKGIKSRLLSSRSCSVDASQASLNTLSTMADVALLLMFMAVRTYIGILTRRIHRVHVWLLFQKWRSKVFVRLVGNSTPPQPLTQTVLTSRPAMFWCYLRTAFPGPELVLCVSNDKELIWS